MNTENTKGIMEDDTFENQILIGCNQDLFVSVVKACTLALLGENIMFSVYTGSSDSGEGAVLSGVVLPIDVNIASLRKIIIFMNRIVQMSDTESKICILIAKDDKKQFERITKDEFDPCKILSFIDPDYNVDSE